MKPSAKPLAATLFALLAGVSWFAGTARAAEQPPNIVFIYADDWGWGDMSGHGHPWLATPNIDRLAQEGVDFLQFNVLSPVCSPSRVGAITGRYPARFGVNDIFKGSSRLPEMPDWLDATAPTIPRLLKTAGYVTGHYGKWHMGRSNIPGAPEMVDYGIDESAVYGGPGPQIDKKGHDIGDRAVAFIKRHKDQPFFLNVWLHESHLPHYPTAESMEVYQHLDKQKQVYAAIIRDGDRKVGQVMRALEDEGIARNTVVIFSSDNGPETPANKPRLEEEQFGKYARYYSVGSTGGLRGYKRSLFEGGVRVPFVVRWPGHTAAGMVNDTTVFTAVDLLPTLCAIAGVAVPAEAKTDGENLIEAFRGKPVKRTRTIHWIRKGKEGRDMWPRLAIREGDWKLLMDFDGSRLELYDLNQNRNEDVAGNQADHHPEVVEDLREQAVGVVRHPSHDGGPVLRCRNVQNQK